MTEREEKLVQYIRDLLTIISVLSLVIDGISQVSNYFDDTLKKVPFNLRTRQEEVIAFVAKEFDEPFTVVSQEEDDAKS